MKTKKKKFRDSSSSSSSQSSDLQPSDLYTAVIRIAVAQICKSVGYRGAQTSALETLTNVAVKYLTSLATSAATSASSTGRTQCNLLDVIRALEDLNSDVGFTGNSDLNRRLYTLTDSSILGDTMKFVYSTRETPFAKPLPRGCHSVPANSPCFSNESGKWKHIPRWLPEFPKTGDEKTVTVAITEDETEKKLVTTESNRMISKLPEKREKVRFRIGSGGRNVIRVKSGGDFRYGICNDDEKFVNDGCSRNNGVKVIQYVRRKKKKKLEEQT